MKSFCSCCRCLLHCHSDWESRLEKRTQAADAQESYLSNLRHELEGREKKLDSRSEVCTIPPKHLLFGELGLDSLPGAQPYAIVDAPGLCRYWMVKLQSCGSCSSG